MLDILNAVGLSADQFAILLGISACILIFAYKRYVISVFDWLNMFIVAMIADTVLMFGLDWATKAKIEFAAFLVLFWCGFSLAGRAPRHYPSIRFEPDALFELEIILLIASVVIVIANLYLGFTAGFPLFSASPSDAKVTAYTGGLGLIRHLNQGPYVFVCCGCTLLAAIGQKRVRALLMLAACSIFLALSGSKGALLPLLFVQAFIMKHRGLGLSSRYATNLKKMTLPSLGAAVVVALAVVVHENGGWVGGLLFLAKRMLYFGDVVLFYYPRQGAIPELVGVGPIDYVHYLFDPVLATFRVLDYEAIRIPLGSIISNSDAGFGPNAQYFVRADVFFGSAFGGIYCLALGYLTGMLRKQFFSFHTSSPVLLTFSLFLAIIAVNLPFESSLFTSILVDTVIFVVPVWCFARVATYSTAVLKPA